MNKIFFPSVNGICCLSENKLTTAIVNSSGSKKVWGFKSKFPLKILKIFFLRGIVFFFSGVFYFCKAYLKCRSLDDNLDENINKTEKVATKIDKASAAIMLFASLILGFLYAFLALGILPPFAVKKAVGGGHSQMVLRLLTALFRVSMVYLTMLALRFAPFMQELYRFNGACCQAVNCKYKATDLDKASIFQPLNFLNFCFFAFFMAIFVISLIPIKAAWFVLPLTGLGILLASFSLSYELLALLESSNVKGMREISIAFAWLVSMRPSVTHKEVAKAVLIEQNYEKEYDMEEDNKVSMSALLAEMQTKLMGNERYEKSDVDWIIANVLGKNRSEIKLIQSLSEKEYRDIIRATERRSKGEPISSIFGFVDFYGLRFDVNKKVLSPRMETEILVEEVLKLAKTMTNPEICDLCTGSGAIAISIAKNCKAKVSAIDISKPAITTAKNNAIKNDTKVDFIVSDLFLELKKSKKFDIIVSNPPYIMSDEIEKLDIEVKNFDPRLALDGGQDGLDFYRKIVKGAKAHLKENGFLFFELGIGQAKEVQKLMEEEDFDDIMVVKDYSKIERIIYGRVGKRITGKNTKGERQV